MRREEGAVEGYALLDQIRRRGDWTPFLIYSIGSGPGAREDVLAHGGQGYAEDPLSLYSAAMQYLGEPKPGNGEAVESRFVEPTGSTKN